MARKMGVGPILDLRPLIQDIGIKEVIKQIPSEELLALAEDLQKTGSGIFDQLA